MKETPSQPIQTKETPSPSTEVQQEEKILTAAEVQDKREQVLKTLEKARLLPDTWSSQSGKSRDEVVTALEKSLEELSQYQVSTAKGEKREGSEYETLTETRPSEESEELRPPGVAKESQKRFDQAAHYLTIGGVHVPVCKPPEDIAQWEAVPSKVFVSGGKKFSEVRFIKDSRGLSYLAKPGELLSFSEKHRGERLESIDTILEGRSEVKAFNEIFKRLAELGDEYENLNPDNPGHNGKAQQIAEQIDKFTTVEGLQEAIDFEQHAGIEDLDDFSERVVDIITTRQFLRSLDENLNEFVPPHDSSFKLTPYFEKKFAGFATLVNRQLGLGSNEYLEKLVRNEQAPDWERLSAKGMSIMVGPRGTGKNKLVDFYCSETNRPLFRYACSPDKEERDLTYDVELQDGEVVRIPTRILTAVTTPNAVLELDELNLLRSNVAKFFNALFDGDRTVFLSDQVIRAAPGTVFVGLMNPAEYDGVQDLPETIDDRSNIITLGYPAFRETDPVTNQERFTHDEALILKEYIAPFTKNG